MKLTRAITAIFSILVFVRCDSSSELSRDTEPETVTIAYLKSLCSGAVHDIRSDLYISGTVTANDWLGEYYKSIVVEDSTGGIEICIDDTRIYERIPVYCSVTVFCNGMTLGRVGGKIELGAHPAGDFPVDALPADAVSTYIRIEHWDGEHIAPAERHPDDIRVEDIGRYVIFREMTVTGDTGNGCWCETENGEYVTTRRRIADVNGNTFTIQTRGGCLYAGDNMPAGIFDVSGIVDYSGGEYFLVTANYGIVIK